MPIEFPCACGKMLRAGDDMAGKLVRCPGCLGVRTVPPHGAAAASAPAPETQFMNLSLDAPTTRPPVTMQEDEMEVVEGEEEIKEAERVNDEAYTREYIKEAERVDGDEYDVVETDRDLPRVKRARKRREKEVPRQGPTRRSIESEFYDRPHSFLGMDVVGSTNTVLYAVFIVIVCFCVASLVLGAIVQLIRVMG
jgi:hypothetical protein